MTKVLCALIQGNQLVSTVVGNKHTPFYPGKDGESKHTDVSEENPPPYSSKIRLIQVENVLL